MATLVLSAAGAAAGSALGGSVLGLTGTVLGRAAGATLGRLIDQRLLGAGSPAVKTGRIERFRLNGASEGAQMARVYGRYRIGGQVIWASRFLERTTTQGGGGKGAPSTPKTMQYSYSVSLAVALCEGAIAGVGRVWADGLEIARDDLSMRVYTGREDQAPDPKIEAVEGQGLAPSYRGTAYVVFEDLELGPYGNRVPQFSFEVIRPEPHGLSTDAVDFARAIPGVALMPGTGEYALATTPVHFSDAPGRNRSANVNSPGRDTDFTRSVHALDAELPSCGAVSLVVSWFGDDLRCGSCNIQPKVEQRGVDGVGMPWRVAGIERIDASEIARVEGRPVYGGTPTDQSVVEAIRALTAAGKQVMFYPFLLMEQLAENGLPDPWSDGSDQPVLPWRGRITLSVAPGRPGSPDGTSAAEDEVAAFFGQALVEHFTIAGERVSYTGPEETSFRRFVLHYAHLCAVAGGVESFCIGSEMRSLTQIRGPQRSFPTVAALRRLAADVRTILGPEVKIGYAADWSEYFGYHPADGTGDVHFHLDPLWADPVIDFVGIDNYMPVSDWRDGGAHEDEAAGSIYELDYLMANIAGGEGYDWYYHAPEAAELQLRTPITDGAHGEHWVFRYKDLASWWSEMHYDRIAGVRSPVPSAWVPGSKPFRFTEYGCPAVDKGTNEPNRFYDPKSSESAVPKYSSGRRDDLIQQQYFRAMHRYWSAPENNPQSEVFAGRMVDFSHSYAWAWDTRPYPQFPGNDVLWSDGTNYERGHWLTGRVSARSLASVVSEICRSEGLAQIDVSRLYGIVRGYAPSDALTAREALQPLMLAYGFDAVERDGDIRFMMRGVSKAHRLDADGLAVTGETSGDFDLNRTSSGETPTQVRVGYLEADGNFDLRFAEALGPEVSAGPVSQSELPLLLTGAEGRAIAERWIAEARVARDGIRLVLPPSAAILGAGDIIELDGVGLFRIDSVEEAGARLIDAVRVESGVYRPSAAVDGPARVLGWQAPLPVAARFADLPLLTGNEDPAAPRIAVFSEPWRTAAVYVSATGDSFDLDRLVEASAVMGVTETSLPRAKAGVWGRGPALRVRLFGGALSSASREAVLAGANVAAIAQPDSDRWEVFQFVEAELVAPLTYDLRGFLRGQAGTDTVIPDFWPSGSEFVLIDASLVQLNLPPSALGLSRDYRVGPASRPVGDPSYTQYPRAFSGVGLRPYAPSHLSILRSGDDLLISWIRRSRLDGDRWELPDVPLGEVMERYLVRVSVAGALRREVEIGFPSWIYTSTDRAADGAMGAFAIEVAQISDRFGPGEFRRISVDE